MAGPHMRITLLIATATSALALAAFVDSRPARADILINIDKSAQRMTVSVDGAPRYTWPVSTGKAGHDTPAGEFQPFRMERDHFSREWDDAPMPHSIFFTQVGHAIHGSYDVRHLGSAASHGCVRLAPANATILYKLVREQGMKNTRVVLTGEPPVLVNATQRIATDEDTTASVSKRARNARARHSDGRDFYYGERGYAPPRRFDGSMFPFGW
jgi:hypothetical protein